MVLIISGTCLVKSSWKTMMFLLFSCSIQSNRCVCQFAFQEQFIEEFSLEYTCVHHLVWQFLLAGIVSWSGAAKSQHPDTTELRLATMGTERSTKTTDRGKWPCECKHLSANLPPIFPRLACYGYNFSSYRWCHLFATAICTNLRQYELL